MPTARERGHAPTALPPLTAHIARAIAEAGGWLPFDAFMQLALYAPEGGYYSAAGPTFGALPEDGSDFITAPELSPLFGRVLAVQVAQALTATGTQQVVEFGAGSGALAEQLLEALPADVGYTIVEVSATLAARQRVRLARFGARVQWASTWPEPLRAVVVGNEVLDAMPVKLLHWDGTAWFERGVALAGDGQLTSSGDGQLAFDASGGAAPSADNAATPFTWVDRPTPLRPPCTEGLLPGTVTEIHPQAEAFIRTLGARLERGAALLIDYGFPEAEYYHPQRHGGTLMCHHRHQASSDPLQRVGQQDITAHVNWSGVALAAQDAGLYVAGYASQAALLYNLGLAPLLAAASAPERARALLLVNEHEMGELFKALLLTAPATPFEPLGFAHGDRSHRL